MDYYGTQGQLEYDLQIDPGVDPKVIELDCEGADKVKIDAQGNLRLLIAGGEVLLGYPGARAQSLTFTDGVQAAQAADLSAAARLYEAGWELGSPGRPGVRVHFPGTRQERLVPANEVYARRATEARGEVV